MVRTDLLKALDRAIEAEQKAKAFYAAAAKKTDDPSGAAMFRELAEFESHHEEHLTHLKESLGSDEDAWIDYPSREIRKLNSGAAAHPSRAGEHTGAIEAVRMAIAAEEKAEREYRLLAEQADDQRGRQMFLRLAEEEQLHRKLLDDQYFSLTNHGVWGWGD